MRFAEGLVRGRDDGALLVTLGVDLEDQVRLGPFLRGLGTGWDLHEYCHSALTHLGEQGASLSMLMARSWHKRPENLRRYFKPSPETISELTGLLASGDARR